MAKTVSVLIAQREAHRSNMNRAIRLMRNLFSKESNFEGSRVSTNPKSDLYVKRASHNKVEPIPYNVISLLKNLKDQVKAYWQSELDTEASNHGVGKVQVTFEGKDLGLYSQNELMKMVYCLKHVQLRESLATIPVRDQNVVWKPSEDEQFQGEGVMQAPQSVVDSNTTLKSMRILPNPNAEKYKPGVKVTEVTEAVEQTVLLAEQLTQTFTSAVTEDQKRKIEERITALIHTFEQAHQQMNGSEATASEAKLDAVMDIIFE
jgi:hypothetical protein